MVLPVVAVYEKKLTRRSCVPGQNATPRRVRIDIKFNSRRILPDPVAAEVPRARISILIAASDPLGWRWLLA